MHMRTCSLPTRTSKHLVRPRAKYRSFANEEGIGVLFLGPNELAASKKHVALEHATTVALEAASAKILEAGLKAGKFIERFALNTCYRIRAKNMCRSWSRYYCIDFLYLCRDVKIVMFAEWEHPDREFGWHGT